VTTVETDTREQVVEELREGTRFVLVTHENPDGDALGSLVAMHGLLSAMGKDSVMFMAADEFPLPHEYRFFDFSGLETAPPRDLDERTVIFLDCGNIDRNPVGAFKRDGAQILNIDHHHDNTRFGTVNHVVEDASCTAEIIWDLMRALEIEPTLEVAEALYVGLVTDTGKFMYENTGVRAHVMAAELIEAGVDVHGIYRRLYEGMPYAKLELLSRALMHVRRYDDGRLTFTRLSRDDFRMAGAEESYSEGIIDHLRSVEGTKVAAALGRRPRPPQGLAPGHRRRGRRLDHRARGRRRRPPPGGGLRHGHGRGGAHRVPARAGRGAAVRAGLSIDRARWASGGALPL
jgi:bifunctional oligoribonuclease and PAP phosphatase NrnA